MSNSHCSSGFDKFDNKPLIDELAKFGKVVEANKQYTIKCNIHPSRKASDEQASIVAYARLLGLSVFVWCEQWYTEKAIFSSGYFDNPNDLRDFLVNCGFSYDHTPIQLTLF